MYYDRNNIRKLQISQDFEKTPKNPRLMYRCYSYKFTNFQITNKTEKYPRDVYTRVQYLY